MFLELSNKLFKKNKSEIKECQNLKCGDLFLFRGIRYVCLSNITNKQNTLTLITCINQNNQLYVLRLFKTFTMEVVYHFDNMTLDHLNNEKDEITNDMIERLEVQLNKI